MEWNGHSTRVFLGNAVWISTHACNSKVENMTSAFPQNSYVEIRMPSLQNTCVEAFPQP